METQVKTLDTEMQRLKGQMVAKLNGSCMAMGEYGGTQYTISYNPVSRIGITKDNLQKLKLLHPDIYDEYVTVSESRRFSIKAKARTKPPDKEGSVPMHDSEQEHSGITGCRVTYESTIFYNEANKFSIIVVKTNDPRIPLQACSGRYYGDRMLRFTAVGYELPRTKAVELELDGEWVESKYGYQLQVEQWQEIVPQTADGLLAYLFRAYQGHRSQDSRGHCCHVRTGHPEYP